MADDDAPGSADPRAYYPDHFFFELTEDQHADLRALLTSIRAIENLTDRDPASNDTLFDAADASALCRVFADYGFRILGDLRGVMPRRAGGAA